MAKRKPIYNWEAPDCIMLNFLGDPTCLGEEIEWAQT